MQVEIPQIYWHDNSARIMSIDVYPNSNYFATASVVSEDDSGIRIWEMIAENNEKQQFSPGNASVASTVTQKYKIEYRYDLQGGHTSTINVVRFSPNGQYLASGSDDQMVIIWTLKSAPLEFGKMEEAIQWGHPRQLRGHVGDVMDLCWSKQNGLNDQSCYLVSCSIDGTAILWNIGGNKFSKIQTFDGHKKLVQGISMDPLMRYIVTMSSDSSVRGYKNRKLKTQLQFFHKFTLRNREEEIEQQEDGFGQLQLETTEADTNAQENNKIKKSSHRMFLDDVEYLCFVRRLSWSPDGTFLLTPASVYQDIQTESKNLYTVYGFLKSDITQPIFMLPGIKSYATCVKFNPFLYKKDANKVYTEENPALLDLPYQMFFAIGTTDQVLIYSTDSIFPISIIGNTHFAPINDLSWIITNDQKVKLIAASSDGFCSIISFDIQENTGLTILGERLHISEMPEKLRGIYEAYESVSFKKFEMEARERSKNSQFKAVSFKSKNATVTTTTANNNNNNQLSVPPLSGVNRDSSNQQEQKEDVVMIET
eukprot:403352417